MCNLLTNYFIKDSFYIQDMCFFQFKMIVSNVVSITITVEFESRKWRGVSIQNYVIKFVSDLLQVCGFLRVLPFPPPIKLKYC